MNFAAAVAAMTYRIDDDEDDNTLSSLCKLCRNSCKGRQALLDLKLTESIIGNYEQIRHN
jgi:hypothetical protein